ncbi:YfhH family protein [Gottfriedia luciferensis]|uniref:YfhH family protein n=1 Tax=Gottfriedia luciferensis TaxID=178774 RepID=UPI000B44C1DC|nr:YfhH family protein [Gottfriedia luciferensis]
MQIPKRYSDLTKDELVQEISELNHQARKAEQMDMINELEVILRKKIMAQSYLLDASQFIPGEQYELIEEPGVLFLISYMNGIFAWGNKSSSEEEIGIPIALLKKPGIN